MEQCWHKLKDAAFLYAHSSYANAYVLAVSAREELGRAGFIWDFLSRMADGECCAANDLDDYLRKCGCTKHIEKLKTGQSSVTFLMENELRQRMIRAHASGEKGDLESVYIEIRDRARRSKDGAPKVTHKRRMEAQYVELDSQGAWLSPRSIAPEETEDLILLTVADLAQCLQTAFLDPMFTSVCAASGVSLPDAFGAVEEVTLRLAMRRD
jgi:AbiV family abortive infection protein